MKKLLVVFMCLFTMSAFAKGSIQIKPYFATYDNKVHYAGGLNIYEYLSKDFAYSQWSGAGESKKGEKGMWLISKHSFDAYLFSWLAIRPGIQFNYFTVDNMFDAYAFVQLDVRLW